MRSTFLGNFVSNIHSRLGHNVTKINYLGDWGTQYGILAVGFKKYGSYELLKTAPIKHLLDVYVKSNADESLKPEALEYFSQMEQSNFLFFIFGLMLLQSFELFLLILKRERRVP
jgi:arginyl-tRNA synthetase